MIGIETLARHHPITSKMIDIRDEQNVVVQLVGVNQQAMVYAAKIAQDMGAVGVDINMGCPVKKLISNGSGAALLKTPKIAADLVEQVKKNIDIRHHSGSESTIFRPKIRKNFRKNTKSSALLIYM